MNAYQHAQRIVSAIKASEAGKAYGADFIEAWPSARTLAWNGLDAPSIAWEDGPYEWAYEFADDGERLGILATDEATRDAVRALEADGFYLECATSWMLSVYPSG